MTEKEAMERAIAVRTSVNGLAALIELDCAIQDGVYNDRDPAFVEGCQYAIDIVHEACVKSLEGCEI
jgi:hypothetical protein